VNPQTTRLTSRERKTFNAAGSQLIVGARVSQSAADNSELEPTLATIPAAVGRPASVLLDNGYLNSATLGRVMESGVESARLELASVAVCDRDGVYGTTRAARCCEKGGDSSDRRRRADTGLRKRAAGPGGEGWAAVAVPTAFAFSWRAGKRRFRMPIPEERDFL